MDIHKNARLTLRSREQLAFFVVGGQLRQRRRTALSSHSQDGCQVGWSLPHPGPRGAQRPDPRARSRVRVPCRLNWSSASSSCAASTPPAIRSRAPPALALPLSAGFCNVPAQPLAGSASGSARAALRTSLPWRSSASRHQRPHPLSGGLAPCRWPPPRPVQASRL